MIDLQYVFKKARSIPTQDGKCETSLTPGQIPGEFLHREVEKSDVESIAESEIGRESGHEIAKNCVELIGTYD